MSLIENVLIGQKLSLVHLMLIGMDIMICQFFQCLVRLMEYVRIELAANYLTSKTVSRLFLNILLTDLAIIGRVLQQLLCIRLHKFFQLMLQKKTGQSISAN